MLLLHGGRLSSLGSDRKLLSELPHVHAPLATPKLASDVTRRRYEREASDARHQEAGYGGRRAGRSKCDEGSFSHVFADRHEEGGFF